MNASYVLPIKWTDLENVQALNIICYSTPYLSRICLVYNDTFWWILCLYECSGVYMTTRLSHFIIYKEQYSTFCTNTHGCYIPPDLHLCTTRLTYILSGSMHSDIVQCCEVFAECTSPTYTILAKIFWNNHKRDSNIHYMLWRDSTRWSFVCSMLPTTKSHIALFVFLCLSYISVKLEQMMGRIYLVWYRTRYVCTRANNLHFFLPLP